MRVIVAIAPGQVEEAQIVHELPEIGNTFNSHVVAALEPCPLVCQQPSPDVYRYSVWIARYADSYTCSYLAIHEAEAELI